MIYPPAEMLIKCSLPYYVTTSILTYGMEFDSFLLFLVFWWGHRARGLRWPLDSQRQVPGSPTSMRLTLFKTGVLPKRTIPLQLHAHISVKTTGWLHASWVTIQDPKDSLLYAWVNCCHQEHPLFPGDESNFNRSPPLVTTMLPAGCPTPTPGFLSEAAPGPWYSWVYLLQTYF